MTEIFPFVWQGLALGFAAAAAPGAFQAYLLDQSVAHGWRTGVRIALAPLLSDGPVIVLLALVLGQLPPFLLGLISVVGSIVLLHLAWGTVREWRAGWKLGSEGASADQRPVVRGALINLTSPGLYLFWGTVGTPLLLSAWAQTPLAAWAFLGAFYGVLMATLAGVALLAHQLRRLPPTRLSAVRLATAALLAILAIALLVNGLRLLVLPNYSSASSHATMGF